MKKIIIIAILMLLFVPIVSATIPIVPPERINNNTLSKTSIQTPRYIPPSDDIEDYTVVIDGDIQSDLECIENVELPNNFGGFPYYSIIYPTGVYFCDNPDDMTDLTLYGLKMVYAFRYTLFDGHVSQIIGSVSYHTISGGVYNQEVDFTIFWSSWFEGCLLFRIGTMPVSVSGQPLVGINLDLNFYEDGRFIWNYGGCIV